MPDPIPTARDREEAARLLPCLYDEPCGSWEDDDSNLVPMRPCERCREHEAIAAALAARDAANAARIAELEAQAAAMRKTLEVIARVACWYPCDCKPDDDESDRCIAWIGGGEHPQLRAKAALSTPAGRELLDAARAGLKRLIELRDMDGDACEGDDCPRCGDLNRDIARLRRAVGEDAR